MSNIGSYEDRVKDFSWSISEKELEYNPGDIINIGWYCSDRICDQGKGDKIALYHESIGGVERKYSFNDIRLAGNTIGTFLRNLGIEAEDRVCLFMDRISCILYKFFHGLGVAGPAEMNTVHSLSQSLLNHP